MSEVPTRQPWKHLGLWQLPEPKVGVAQPSIGNEPGCSRQGARAEPPTLGGSRPLVVAAIVKSLLCTHAASRESGVGFDSMAKFAMLALLGASKKGQGHESSRKCETIIIRPT